MWELRVELARDPVTGKRRQLSRTIYGSERAASRELARLVVEADGIDVVTREGGDVDALHERWISHLEARGRERSTIYGYRKKYGQVSELIGKLPVAMVTTERIDAAYDELVRRGCGTGTVAHVHRTLRAMFTQARKWRMIDHNPVTDASAPSHHAAARPLVEPATVRALIDTAAPDDPWLAAFIRVSAVLGTRRGETLALRWCDVGEDAITVSESVVAVPDGRGLERKSTKTHASGRSLAIPRRWRCSIGCERFPNSEPPRGTSGCRMTHTCSVTNSTVPARGIRTSPLRDSCG